jgi:hypothetical protein
MKKFAIAGAAALATVGAASADFTGVSVMSMGEILPGTVTYRIMADFSSPDDSVLAVSASQQALRWSGAALVQDSPGFETLALQDTPFIASGPADSWVTIGGNFEGGQTDTTFSPGFLSPAFPGASVINGSFFEQLENGGYFDFDPGTPENGGSVVIAQFTIAAGAAGTYEGTVDWQGSGAGFTSNVFSVLVPAPGAMALLGLAGLAGSRRRRG